MLSPKLYHTLSSQGWQIIMEDFELEKKKSQEPEAMDDYKETLYFGHNRAVVLMNSYSACIRPVQVPDRLNPTWWGKVGMKSHH